MTRATGIVLTALGVLAAMDGAGEPPHDGVVEACVRACGRAGAPAGARTDAGPEARMHSRVPLPPRPASPRLGSPT